MYEVTSKIRRRGHYLRNYKGSARTARHNYKVRVTLAGKELDKAVVADFKTCAK